MKFVLITQDPEMVQAAKAGFQPNDETLVFEDWATALGHCEGADLLFVDLVATLDEPHKIAGYEKFAEAKMASEEAAAVPEAIQDGANEGRQQDEGCHREQQEERHGAARLTGGHGEDRAGQAHG